MVLQEPYCSVLLKKNPKPHTERSAFSVKPLGNERRTLIADKPNNRLRQVLAAVELHVPGAAAQTNFSSTMRTQFCVQPAVPRHCKYDFTKSTESSKLGGLGRSIAGVDSTADWQSCKSSTIDDKNASFRCASMVENRGRVLSERKELEEWKSMTRMSYGKGCLAAVKAASPERRRNQGLSTLQLAWFH